VPVVGSTIVELLRGGTSVGQGTLTRFYTYICSSINYSCTYVSTLNDQKTRYFRTIINQILSHYEILLNKLF
jgi:hypothetical protein